MNLFDIKKLKHLCRGFDFNEHLYDVPIEFMSYHVNLIAIYENRLTSDICIYDYSACIEDDINANERPAIIIKDLTETSLYMHRYNIATLTVEQVQQIINVNIAALTKLNQYFNECIMLAKLSEI